MLLVPFFIVLVISIGASFVASKKEKDFFLAGRSIRWPMLFGTLLGTQLGGGFLLGNSDAASKLGICGILYSLGLAVGMLVLGLGYGGRLRSLHIATLGELLEKKYGKRNLKTFYGLFSVLSLLGILMCQAIAVKKFLLSLSCTNELVYICAWGAVIIYTSYGGLLAVIWTDLIQAIIMIAMLGTIFFEALLPRWDLIATQVYSIGVPLDGRIAASLIVPFCFMLLEQDMAQRCFAARSSKDVKIGALITFFCMIVFSVIPLACGALARSLGMSSENGSVFMQVIQAVSNPYICSIAATAVLLAIISTASSVLLAASSNLSQDLVGGNAQLLTLLLGFLALLGPYFGGDIISWMVSSYEICVATLLVPVVMAVLSRRERLSSQAAWTAVFSGTAGLILSYLLPVWWSASIPILFSSLGFAIATLYTRNTFVGEAA